MGIFSGLFKSRDKPTDSTVGSRYTFYMGGSTSGKTVTERSAMQMTAVYSCVRILAEAIAGLPLHVYRYNSDGGKEKAIDHSHAVIPQVLTDLCMEVGVDPHGDSFLFAVRHCPGSFPNSF